MSIFHHYLKIQATFIPSLWDPVNFPEPDAFRPERHLDANGQFEKNEHITPFGVGKLHFKITENVHASTIFNLLARNHLSDIRKVY